MEGLKVPLCDLKPSECHVSCQNFIGSYASTLSTFDLIEQRRLERQSLFINLGYNTCQYLWSQLSMCKSTKTCTQLNTQFYADDNTEQFKPHFTDIHKWNRIKRGIKLH